MLLSRLSSSLPKDHSRKWIFGGKTGTAQTIGKMRDLVTQGKRDFRIRTVAGQLCRQCSSKDYLCYAQRIFEFCRDRIKYVFDPVGVELLEAPYRILESGVADCDSIVVLLASMLEAVGFSCEFVTIKADAKRPDEYSHVFLRCKVAKTGWVEMDATMQKPFGWGPPAYFARKYWPASNDQSESHEDDAMAGFSGQGAIPHLEYAKGQVPGGIWNWRNEATLITTNPEQLELEPLAGKKSEGLPAVSHESSYFQAEQAQQRYFVPPVVKTQPYEPSPGQPEVQDVHADKQQELVKSVAVGVFGLWVIWRLFR